MPTRNVSFIGQNMQQSSSIISFLPSRWSNYALAIWSPDDSLMLQLELHQSWSDENFVWFKRVDCISSAHLLRRKVGTTEWSNEAIALQGIKIVAAGPPYGSSKRWHLLWADHQTFVEEMANVITKNLPPHESPALPVHRGPAALLTWDGHSPIAVTFQMGDRTISDEWIGGPGMLYGYPGGPARHKS